MWKRQTSVSHRSTESAVISSDAGLRMDGIPALDFWDLVVEVLHSSLNQHRARENLCRDEQPEKRSNAKTKKHSNHLEDPRWTNVDYATSNAKLSHLSCLLHTFEDNDAVIKMWVTLSQTQNLLNLKRSCIFLKTIKQRSIALFQKTNQYRKTCCGTQPKRKHTNTKTKKHINRDDVEEVNVDHVTTSTNPSHFDAMHYIFEDNEAR